MGAHSTLRAQHNPSNHNMPQHTLKISFHGDIRRIPVPSVELFTSQELLRIVNNSFSLAFPRIFTSENIEITTPEEWKAYLINMSSNQPIRIIVEENGTEESITLLTQPEAAADELIEENELEEENEEVPEESQENEANNSLRKPCKRAVQLYIQSLVTLEENIRPSLLNWASSDEEVAWKLTAQYAENMSDLIEVMQIFIDKIPQNIYNAWRNDFGGMIFENENTAICFEDLITTLESLEYSIVWSFTIPSFHEIRKNWLSSLSELRKMYEESCPLDEEDNADEEDENEANEDEGNEGDEGGEKQSSFNIVVHCLLQLNDVMKEELMKWSEEQREDWIVRVSEASTVAELGRLMHIFAINVPAAHMYNGWKNNTHPEITPQMLENATIYQLGRCLSRLETAISWNAVYTRFENERDEFQSKLTSIPNDGSIVNDKAVLSEEDEDIEEEIYSDDIEMEFKDFQFPGDAAVGDKISCKVDLHYASEEDENVDLTIALGNRSFNIITIRIRRTDEGEGYVKCFYGIDLLCDSVEEWVNPFPIHDKVEFQLEIVEKDCFTLKMNGNVFAEVFTELDSSLLLTDITMARFEGEANKFTIKSLDYSFFRSVSLL